MRIKEIMQQAIGVVFCVAILTTPPYFSNVYATLGVKLSAVSEVAKRAGARA